MVAPRKSLITAMARVGTRFPPPAKLVFSAFSINKLPLVGSLSHCIRQLKRCVHKHTKHLIGVLALFMAISLSPMAATGQAIPAPA